MNKKLIAGAASVALAAMPVFGAFATNPAAVQDSLTVNINESCTFARTVGSNTYSKEMLANAYDSAFGTSTFTSHCNNGTGYAISVAFTSLTFTGATAPITYSDTGSSAGSGTWSAKLSGASTYLAASNATVDTQSTEDPAAGRSVSVVYSVGLLNNQPKGTYVGTATYTLAQN